MTRLTIALTLIFLSIACATIGTSLAQDRARVVVENNSFNISSVRLYCDGAQVWRFSTIPSGQTDSKRLSLARCSRVNIVVEHLGSRDVMRLDDITTPIYGDSQLIINVGNTYSTTWYRIQRGEIH